MSRSFASDGDKPRPQRPALAELKAKARHLPFFGRYKKVLYRLFVAENAREDDVSLNWIEDPDIAND